GPVFIHPEWETVVYRSGKLQNISSYYPFVFVNPAMKEVQDYELSLIREVMQNYAFDGISLDYCRFAGFNADFSPAGRQAFEEYIGSKVVVWPDDVFGGGVWRTKWLEWRSQVIKGFVEKARAVVTKARPSCVFSAYYGGWYRHHWGWASTGPAVSSSPPTLWLRPITARPEWRRFTTA
ncbi:MAG: family 10 glycosylhydrolase, partial [bacterium]|nr:family 10 glycosylhydrolase [bacterium]